MSRQEKRLQQIERSALREAQKALDRHPGRSVTHDELASLRVQTLTVGLRLMLGLAGVAAIAGGIYFFRDDDLWWLSIALFLFALVAFTVAAFGWRRTLAEGASALGEGVLNIVVEAVFKSLR